MLVDLGRGSWWQRRQPFNMVHRANGQDMFFAWALRHELSGINRTMKHNVTRLSLASLAGVKSCILFLIVALTLGFLQC